MKTEMDCFISRFSFVSIGLEAGENEEPQRSPEPAVMSAMAIIT